MTDDLHKRAEDAVTRLKDYENVYPGDEVDGELYLRAADVIAALAAKLALVIAAYRIEAMRRDDYSHDAFDQHIAELKGQIDHDLAALAAQEGE